MTDTEINIAIAEACGWKKVIKHTDSDWPISYWYQPGPCDTGHLNVPNYCHDLNAMHEVELTLKDEFVNAFEAHLNAICARGDRVCDWTLHPSDKLWHATARQRAESFLRVKGLWKD